MYLQGHAFDYKDGACQNLCLISEALQPPGFLQCSGESQLFLSLHCIMEVFNLVMSGWTDLTDLVNFSNSNRTRDKTAIIVLPIPLL